MGHQVFIIGEHTPRKNLPKNVVFHDLTKIINIRKLRYVVWSLAIRKYLREIQPDILHTFGVASAGWLGFFSGYHPRIATVTGTDILHLDQRSRIHQCLSIYSLQKADYVLCVSSQLKQLVMNLGIQEHKIGTSIFGVNMKIFHPIREPNEARKKLGLDNLPTIISLRAIQIIYNPTTIAKAIARVLNREPQVQFIIFTYHSDPDLLAQFKTIIQDHDIEYAVRYIDDLSDDRSIAAYLQASDIAISIPSTDGTPSSVLESMACGTPVVVSDLPSLHTWIQPDIHGVFIPAGNAQALADAVLRILSNKDLRTLMSSKAHAIIKDKADQEKWIKETEDLYQQILGSNSYQKSHNEI